MDVRAYSSPDGSVRLVAPASGAADAEAADPTLAALPHVDVDAATLPDRAKRYAWRVSGNAVVIDAAVLEAPAVIELKAAYADLAAQYTAAMTRLTGIVTNGPTYTAPQVRDAVVDMAKIVQATLRYLKATV